MASFVHLADARDAKRLERNGIRATKGRDGLAVVFCVPVLPNFQTTFQWLRELKRSGYRSTCAVQFRVPDAEPVFAGRYAKDQALVTAAEAIGVFLAAEDPRGLEVRIPRAIAPREIVHVRAAPHIAGWRYFPAAKHGQPFWPLTPGIKTKRLQRVLDKRFDA